MRYAIGIGETQRGIRWCPVTGQITFCGGIHSVEKKLQSPDSTIRPRHFHLIRWIAGPSTLWWICGTRSGFEGEACGIPHLAKYERDVGHPAIGAGIERVCECREALPHHPSAA
jgi:hypothetical protein